jgi:hypothetical protein
MTDEEAVAKLEAIKLEHGDGNIYDPESVHSEADELLLEILRQHGYYKLVREFMDLRKWYA